MRRAGRWRKEVSYSLLLLLHIEIVDLDPEDEGRTRHVMVVVPIYLARPSRAGPPGIRSGLWA